MVRLRVDLVRGAASDACLRDGDALGQGSRRGPKRRSPSKELRWTRRTLVIFQVLLDWEGNKATEIGPLRRRRGTI